MGNDRRRGRRHPGRPLWRALILLVLAKVPPARPYGGIGAEKQPETDKCHIPGCNSKADLQGSMWVCSKNPKHRRPTQPGLE